MRRKTLMRSLPMLALMLRLTLPMLLILKLARRPEQKQQAQKRSAAALSAIPPRPLMTLQTTMTPQGWAQTGEFFLEASANAIV